MDLERPMSLLQNTYGRTYKRQTSEHKCNLTTFILTDTQTTNILKITFKKLNRSYLIYICIKNEIKISNLNVK